MKRKRITVRVSSAKLERESFNFTFKQAFEYFTSAKKSEGLRNSTLVGHDEHFRFFVNWLNNFHPELKKVNEINPVLLRDYINYMQDDHFNFKTKKCGLGIQTINARIRFLKTFYALLYKEEIANSNPLEQIKLLRADETPFEPLTEDEMKRLLDVPDLKKYPQWRDYCVMMLLYDTGMRILLLI
ncbi:tyrosine-type recombinase/integrase [Metabacillus herbersteinensis]|uniref:Tyrosine-type recombinase/integrase n=1 Tax=Metabacillus herbersteinensis TaxID=283816 RepID=A0ABV6GDC0_9BACI